MHSPDHTTWSVPSNTHGHDTNNSNFSDMSKSALGSPIDLICYLTCPSCLHPDRGSLSARGARLPLSASFCRASSAFTSVCLPYSAIHALPLFFLLPHIHSFRHSPYVSMPSLRPFDFDAPFARGHTVLFRISTVILQVEKAATYEMRLRPVTNSCRDHRLIAAGTHEI